MESSIAEIRNNLAEIVNQVAYGRERVTLERRGKPIAVIVSVEDANRLTELDALLAAAAAEQLHPTKPKPRRTSRPKNTPRAEPNTTTKRRTRNDRRR